MNKTNHKKSQVLMKTSSGYEHMFESIQQASRFAHANAWTMSLKMEVFGYFEDKQGNKYYRQDKMNTKNEYESSSPKIIKPMKKTKRMKKIHGNAKKIVVDDVVYDTISEAEEKLGIKKDTIGQALRQKRKKSMGHTIAYYNENTPVIEEPKQPKVEIKDENISVVINSKDPAIKLINDRIVDILKKAGVYEEIQKLSKAIQKLSK